MKPGQSTVHKSFYSNNINDEEPSFNDYQNLYKLAGKNTRPILYQKMKEVADCFDHWLEIFYLAQDHDKQLALDNLFNKAKTFFNWVIVYGVCHKHQQQFALNKILEHESHFDYWLLVYKTYKSSDSNQYKRIINLALIKLQEFDGSYNVWLDIYNYSIYDDLKNLAKEKIVTLSLNN